LNFTLRRKGNYPRTLTLFSLIKRGGEYKSVVENWHAPDSLSQVGYTNSFIYICNHVFIYPVGRGLRVKPAMTEREKFIFSPRLLTLNSLIIERRGDFLVSRNE